MAHATQILVQNSPKKGSVRFDAKESEKYPMFQSLYLMREGVKKALGIKDLDSADQIEVTVRVVGTGKSKKSEEEEE